MKKLLIIFMIAYFGIYSIVAVGELRDPTRPADFSFTPNQQGPLALTSVMIGPDKKIAIINDMVVKVGDEIFGNKVIEINTNTVQLEGGSGRITLFLLDKPVKQSVNK